MYNRLIIILIACLITIGCTHRFDGVEDNTPVGNMECLWRTLDEKYCYFEEKNVDWQQVHDQYLTRVKNMKNNNYTELFDTLSSMINLLQDGHVNLYSSFDISICSSWYKGHASNFDWDVITNHYLKDYRIAGGAYYSTLSANHIGYMYVKNFETAVSAANMYYMISAWKENNCKGLIVDVRDNGGGSMDYAYQLAATFFERDTVVGYWQHKNGTGHEDFSALEEQVLNKKDMPSSWLRPVVVLCNRHTYSAANFFVSVMRYAPCSCIMGSQSGGGGGMPMSYELPNGWLIRFSSIRMFDRDQQSIENGITPVRALDDESTTDKDECIEEAIKWINNYYTK